MFKKMLVAEFGESAVRIIRACRELRIETIAIHSRTDANSRAVQLADESTYVGPTQAKHCCQPHLPAIITAALVSGADAIHPGDGPLCENTDFAEICSDYKISRIGPTPAVLACLSNKTLVKRLMQRAGLPVVPGAVKAINSIKHAADCAQQLGYPVVLQLDSGGGQRATVVAQSPADLEHAYDTQKVNRHLFTERRIFMEKCIQPSRQINVSVLCDSHGHGVCLGESDCVVQEQGQLVVAEAPSIHLSSDQRRKISELALQAALAVNYTGPGTLQFLLDHNGNYFFNKFNTRLAAEHPITETITDIDLTQEQIRMAADQRLRFTQEDIRFRSHVLGFHIHAVDPDNDFAPQSGTIEKFVPAHGLGTRVDTHVYSGWNQPSFYTSLLAKLTVWADNRADAVNRMLRAVGETTIQGVRTNIPSRPSLLSYYRETSNR